MRLLSNRLILLTVTAPSAFAADITGTWNFPVGLAQGGHGDPIFVLQQTGNGVSGEVDSGRDDGGPCQKALLIGPRGADEAELPASYLLGARERRIQPAMSPNSIPAAKTRSRIRHPRKFLGKTTPVKPIDVAEIARISAAPRDCCC